MKIICIGRNYAKHAHELGNAIPESPVLFIKPETALLKDHVFSYPNFSSDVHFELEIVLKISKTGKNISVEDASEYFEEIALGIDFTARDLQSELKSKGLPWEKAKAFDGSAAVSDFIKLAEMPDAKDIQFELYQQNELRQQGNSRDMIFGFDAIIAHASSYFTLEEGDLIFTGTPEGVGPVQPKDKLSCSLEGRKLLEITVV